MNQEQRQAYEWAKNQNYQSVAARYAKILAGLVDEMTPPNEALTLEELREMSYTDWVWVVFPELPSEENGWVRASQLYRRYSHEHYGKTWIAYRRPPEGEANA